MIAIPSREINITSSNVVEGVKQDYEGWAPGAYGLNEMVKIIAIPTDKISYVGKAFVSLKNGNDTHPLDVEADWHELEDLSVGNQGEYTEWVAGGYSRNDTCKVTTFDFTEQYIGKIFKSLVADNETKPTDEENDWVQVAIMEYDETRVYNNGDTVAELSTHGIYLSMENGNNTSPLSAESKWQFIGKTNRHRATDFYFSTATEQVNDDIVMEFTFSNSDHLSLFGIFGSSVTVEQLDVENGDAVLHTDRRTKIDTSRIIDFASYL